MKLFFKVKQLVTVTGVVFASLAGSHAFAAQTVDAAIPSYQKASGISGNLSSVGSDTLANLMTLWAEEFNRNYPNVTFRFRRQGLPPRLLP